MCLLLPVFFLFSNAQVSAQPLMEPIDTAISRIMAEHQAVGLSVVVIKKNAPVFFNTFGYKDIETSTPLEIDNLFRIASISKSFSATAIMQLVEQKKIKLDDDVSNLIGFQVRNPKFPETVITLRLLLSHLSSINDSQGYFSLDAINPAKNPDWAKCYSDYAPGKNYSYCNLNFNMIGTIIERISGERFDQYIKNHILDPLGLYGGYCVDSLDRSRFASIYEYLGDSTGFRISPGAYNPRSEEIANYTMGYSTPVFSPTGGMKISSFDLARYMTMHKNQGKLGNVKIISRKSAKLMQTPVSSIEPYGFAIERTDKLIPGKTLTGHTGSAYGLFSAMFFEPNENFGIVVITNGCKSGYTDGFNNMIRKVINALYTHIVSTNPTTFAK